MPCGAGSLRQRLRQEPGRPAEAGEVGYPGERRASESPPRGAGAALSGHPAWAPGTKTLRGEAPARQRVPGPEWGWGQCSRALRDLPAPRGPGLGGPPRLQGAGSWGCGLHAHLACESLGKQLPAHPPVSPACAAWSPGLWPLPRLSRRGLKGPAEPSQGPAPLPVPALSLPSLQGPSRGPSPTTRRGHAHLSRSPGTAPASWQWEASGHPAGWRDSWACSRP